MIDLISEITIDENINSVVVGLIKMDKAVEKEIRELAPNPEVLQFTRKNRGNGNTNPAPGSMITVGDGYYSLGFRCKVLYGGSSSIYYYNGQFISGLIRSSYNSTNGDSGGIVYTYYNSQYVLVGIHVANLTSNISYCCPAHYIIDGFGAVMY